MSMPNADDTARYRVGSVWRALQIVSTVAQGSAQGSTLSELAHACGLSKSATHSLVRTLVDAGYLRAIEPGPRYTLGIVLVHLGDVAARQFPLTEMAAPILRKLSEETRLTIRLAIADDGYPVFVERIDALDAVRFHAPLGVRELPHTSAAGKAILATLTDAEVQRIAEECGLPRRTAKSICDVPTLLHDLAMTRRRGYAIDDEEDVDGVFCVAAPFFDHRGRCGGALSATGVKVGVPTWRLQELGDVVRLGAEQLTKVLGGTLPAEWEHAR